MNKLRLNGFSAFLNKVISEGFSVNSYSYALLNNCFYTLLFEKKLDRNFM